MLQQPTLLSLNNRFNPSLTQTVPPGTSSADILALYQQRFGAVKYNQQSVSRYPYFSYQAYPAAGAASLGFFGTNMATSTAQLTNIEQAGTLGNYSYLLSSISFDIFLYIPTVASNGPWTYTTDALAPYSDIVHGLTQGGYATLTINNTVWDDCALPFMFSPASIGKNRLEVSQGAFTFSQAGGSPFAVTGSQASLCFADILRRAKRRRNFTNQIFMAPQQTFDMSLFYDFGAIPIISTSVITGSAILYVGVIFDGWRFAPVS